MKRLMLVLLVALAAVFALVRVYARFWTYPAGWSGWTSRDTIVYDDGCPSDCVGYASIT